MSTPVLRTERLILREWRPEDREPFAALNADPRVMECMPALLPRAQSDALARRSEQHFATHGFGPWAVEVPDVAPFIGFVGLSVPAFEAHFTPCVEIGWRLAAEHWGHGYATEAALASARFAFDDLEMTQLVSFTTPAERPLPGGDAADRHDPRRGGRFRPPATPSRPPPAASCALPTATQP